MRRCLTLHSTIVQAVNLKRILKKVAILSSLKVASAVHVTELLPENAATLGNISFEPGTFNWKERERVRLNIQELAFTINM